MSDGQRFTLADVLAATGGGVVEAGAHDAAAVARRVATDTRALPDGCWFVALRGARFDAHDLLAEAVAAGAGGLVVDREGAGVGLGVPVVRVDDTASALGRLGAAARDRVHGPVVGVGGAAGKTTTRTLVALALRPLGRVHATAGNLNNHLGVPLTLLAMPDGAAAAVVELGTSGHGEIAVLSAIARPNVRLIVNIGPEHLEGLGDLDGVAREELVLFDTARAGDVAIVNADDPYLAAAALPPGVRAVRWGRAADADVRLCAATVDAAAWATDAVYEIGHGEARLRVGARIPAPGAHLAHNAGAALAVAWALGVDVHAAAAALADYAPVGMRLRPTPLAGGVLAINDAYNANPPSVAASVGLLADLVLGRVGSAGQPARAVAVLGDLLELGDAEAAWHDQVAADAAQRVALLVLVGPRMARAAAAARAAGSAGGGAEVWAAEDGLALAEALSAWLRDGDVVLFKGSRGARVERVLEAVSAARAAHGEESA